MSCQSHRAMCLLLYMRLLIGRHVNTKNWYREETDMWAEFGIRAPFLKAFGRRRLRSGVHRHSAEELFHGWKQKTFGNSWWRGLDIKKGMNWWWIRDEHDAMVLILGDKCCNRGRLGVVLEPGYKYKPLVFVIGIEQIHNKPAPFQLSSPPSRVIEFFERSQRSVDLRKYRQPCIMSSIMRWI
jgi:hypothetical protein